MNSDRREDGNPKEVPVTLHGRGGAHSSTAVAHWMSHIGQLSWEVCDEAS
jgi:hypothetical protein